MKRFPESFYDSFRKMKEIKREMAKVIIGQEETINHILICLFSGGHLLLESMPGLAKSMMVEALAKILNVDYKRIQLTPDLTPQDITGYSMPVWGTADFITRKGPIFTGLILADEFNRASEKAQSAFMEVMQEKQVSIDGINYKLEEIFTLIGTRNPIETGGTFAVAEAILDRFMLNAVLDYPSLTVERQIAVSPEIDKVALQKVCGPENILPIRNYLRDKEFLPVDYPIVDYIVRLVKTSRPNECELFLAKNDSEEYKSMVKCSLASPRADKAYLRAVLVYSLGILGEKIILPEHVKTLAKSFFRHRLILQFGAEHRGLTPDQVVDWLLDRIPIYSI
jgi:MoxR-like ATPase